MPEFKRAFTGGKMEKDLDERMVPNGLYREALNIEVATSEGSDVGAAQNILGNIKITEAINGPRFAYESAEGGSIFKYAHGNRHIALIADPETDMLYRFVNTEAAITGVWMDRIIEYDTTKTLTDSWDIKEAPVLIDIYKVRTECVEWAPDECDQPTLKVYKNYAQLRPYMAVVINTIQSDIYIQKITYGSDANGDFAIITLNHFPGDEDPDCGEPWFFVADRVLNFHPDRKITGINIIDGMIFWTDNYSEPKKINIKRSKLGSKYHINPENPNAFIYPYKHFDRHTRLIINVDEVTGLGENPIECIKSEQNCPIPGCIDPIAINYDPNATVMLPDSCIYANYGCTDGTTGGDFPDVNGNDMNGNPCSWPCPDGYIVTNFDPDANINEVSASDPSDPCCYEAGCTDPTYCSYQEAACYHIPSYCSGLYGCMDSNALNYNCATSLNPNSTIPCSDNVLCDDGTCVYAYSCNPAGYGIETCTDEAMELDFTGLYVTNNFGCGGTGEFACSDMQNRTFQSLALSAVAGAQHGEPVSNLWYGETVPGSTYSSNPLANNYYAKDPPGECVYSHTGGTWLEKHRLHKLTVDNLLPTDPGIQLSNNNSNNWLFDGTLHLGSSYDSATSGPSIWRPGLPPIGGEDRYLTVFYPFDENSCKPTFWEEHQNWTYNGGGPTLGSSSTQDCGGGATPWMDHTRWSGESPAFLQLLASRGFGPGFFHFTSNGTQSNETRLAGTYKHVWAAVLSNAGNANSPLEMQKAMTRIKLNKASNIEWGVMQSGSPPDDIVLTKDYGLFGSQGTSNPPAGYIGNTIYANDPPPHILPNGSWEWEDILRVLQASWTVFGQNANEETVMLNNANEQTVFKSPTEAISFDIGIENKVCSCSGLTACSCDVDAINGVYTSEALCLTDNGQYGTCCSGYSPSSSSTTTTTTIGTGGGTAGGDEFTNPYTPPS